jgi:urease accessory protein UreE
MYEVRLIEGTAHKGEIVYRDDKSIRVRLRNKKIVLVSRDGILLMQDLGWKIIKA